MSIPVEKTLCILGSFLSGFSVMTVELVSSRIVAPIIGSSVFTWTSVIGITLLGLSLGSLVGGKTADKIKNNSPLPVAFLISSLFVFIIPTLTKNTAFIVDSSNSILWLNILLSLYLFLLPALAIGTIQPIILKKYANDFSKIGSEYGILSSVWSFGSILGVFLTGFFFISTIGSTETIWTISIILFLIGSVFAIGNKKILSIYAIVAILVVLFIFTTSNKILDLGNLSKTIYQNETNYYKAKVVDANIPGFGQSRILFLDFDSHSIQPEKTNEYFYPEMYPVFSNIKKNIKDILVIGAGAYTMPKYFKDYYKNSNVSVIEMDPKMVDIGNNYFDLKKYDINTLVGDARVIISKDPKKYDVIFGDAYNSFISVPWYLLTKEWNSNVKERLNDGGVYAINFIGSLIGSGSEFTKSVLNTFKISFQNYYMFSFGLTPESTQNIVLVGIKGDLPLSEKDLYQKLLKGNMSFLARRMVPIEFFTNSTSMVLTDNFSPVEKLMMPTVEKYFPNNLEFNKLFQ